MYFGILFRMESFVRRLWTNNQRFWHHHAGLVADVLHVQKRNFPEGIAKIHFWMVIEDFFQNSGFD